MSKLNFQSQKIKNTVVCLESELEKKSVILCFRQTGLVLKIRMYDLADKEKISKFWGWNPFFVFLDFD